MILFVLATLLAPDNIIPIKASVRVPELPSTTCDPALHVSRDTFDFNDAQQGDGGFRVSLWTECGMLYWWSGDRPPWLDLSRYNGVLRVGDVATIWVRASYERLRPGTYMGNWDIGWRPCPVGDLTLDCQVDWDDLSLLTGWDGMILSTFAVVQNNWRRAGWVHD